MSNNNYDAKQFSDLANQPLGKDLWQLLNRPDNLIRMETAIDLQRPAAEAVSRQLLETFGDKVREDRIKQMIGHMIRQILEARNYKISSQGVVVRTGGLFTKATRYCR